MLDLHFPPPPRLNMATVNTSSAPFTNRGFDSPSPYPPSSSTDSSTDDDEKPHYLSGGIRASIATIPESKLRSIMVKLADTNPRFQRAIMKELTYAQPLGDSPPTTPTTAKQRKARRSKPRRNCKGLSVSTQNAHANGHKHGYRSSLEIQNEPVYHPGPSFTRRRTCGLDD
jgi:hypothetical protein